MQLHLLKAMLDRGEITPEQLSNMTLQIGNDVSRETPSPYALDRERQADRPRLEQWYEAIGANPPSGKYPPRSMQAINGQDGATPPSRNLSGMNFIRNEETGQVTNLGPSANERTYNISTAGLDRDTGQTHNLGTVQQKGYPPIDGTRSKVYVQGEGEGNWGTDGAIYINTGGNSYKKIVGYNHAQATANEDRALKLDIGRANLAKTQAETRNLDLKPIQDGRPRPPTDMRYGADGEFEIIPNSKTDMKRKDKMSGDKSALLTVDRATTAVLNDINALIGDDGLESGKKTVEHPGLQRSVGYMDSKLFPFTQNQADAQAKIKALLAKSSVEGLQAIRQSGTAPGSITEKEWPIFQNYLGTLDAAQSEDEFRKSLAEFRNGLRSMRERTKAQFAERYGDVKSSGDLRMPENGNTPKAEYDAMPKGATYKFNGKLLVKQ